LPNRVEQREDDREHGIRKLSLLSFKFNWLSENGIFDRDTSSDRINRSPSSRKLRFWSVPM
jgi:hypothetical protein